VQKALTFNIQAGFIGAQNVNLFSELHLPVQALNTLEQKNIGKK